jgi:DNA-binding NarL/FixJ family response regulator
MTQERRKILCIEDDRETANLIVEELVGRDFDVSAVYSGREGLRAILESAPDLVLCDIRMQDITGLEVLERLNQFAPGLGHIPFVFLTALADRDDELRGRLLGADDYVTKPIDFERLVHIINGRIAGVARTLTPPPFVKLTERELEILTLVARGQTSSGIARRLQLSKRTVDFHIDNARIKMRATTRTEAAIKAASFDLIKP